MQWSLKTLLAAAAIIPPSIYAYMKPSPMLATGAVSVSLLAFAAVSIVAYVSRGQRQAWCRGAMIAGGLYGLLVYHLGTESQLYGSRLPTSFVLMRLHQTIGNYDPVPDASDTMIMSDFSVRDIQKQRLRDGRGNVIPSRVIQHRDDMGTTTYLEPVYPYDFGTIGHCYWAVAFGLLGAWFAVWIVRQERPEHDEGTRASVSA